MFPQENSKPQNKNHYASPRDIVKATIDGQSKSKRVTNYGNIIYFCTEQMFNDPLLFLIVVITLNYKYQRNVGAHIKFFVGN